MTETLADAGLSAEAERAWLVCYCARTSGKAEYAEDLAQETLLEAWRQRHKLTDPAARLPWLAAIARHIIQRSARARGRELQHLVPLEDEEDALHPALHESADFEHDLERAELAALLDHALAQLPAETRLALIAHYIEELPQTEIAARLGISVGTLAVRLHRGKLLLRHIFATDLSSEAAPYGLDLPASTSWRDAGLWCPICGRQRLEGRLDPLSNHLLIRCTVCSQGPFIDHRTPLLRGLTNCRSALRRVFEWVNDYFPPALQSGSVRCMQCGKRAPIHVGLPGIAAPEDFERASLYVACPCQVMNTCDLALLALASPEGQRFRSAHPRLRLVSLNEQEINGTPSLLISFASLTEAARLDVVAARDTLQPLQVHLTT